MAACCYATRCHSVILVDFWRKHRQLHLFLFVRPPSLLHHLSAQTRRTSAVVHFWYCTLQTVSLLFTGTACWQCNTSPVVAYALMAHPRRMDVALRRSMAIQAYSHQSLTRRKDFKESANCFERRKCSRSSVGGAGRRLCGSTATTIRVQPAARACMRRSKQSVGVCVSVGAAVPSFFPSFLQRFAAADGCEGERETAGELSFVGERVAGRPAVRRASCSVPWFFPRQTYHTATPSAATTGLIA